MQFSTGLYFSPCILETIQIGDPSLERSCDPRHPKKVGVVLVMITLKFSLYNTVCTIDLGHSVMKLKKKTTGQTGL